MDEIQKQCFVLSGVVRHSVVNDLPLGRSVTEALRMVDSLQVRD